ncbi:MAG: mevalonate kinase [Anaerolineaceae bacterium]
MPAVSATASAKIILLGEHAVVYNQPAIAVPVSDVRARVAILANPLGKSGEVEIFSKQIGLHSMLENLPPEHAFPRLFHSFLNTSGVDHLPSMQIHISSDIPVASGMGSGAAVSVAMLKALYQFSGLEIKPEQLSTIAYEAEKAYHGNPSGIDNTVIAYETPVYFIRDQPVTFLQVPNKFSLLIANSGIPGKTIETVSAVRQRYENEPETINVIMQQIGDLVQQARYYLENGNLEGVGDTFNQNHLLLQKLGVSIPELDNLVNAALKAGAMGAKLSGGGGGGNIIALVDETRIASVEKALTLAGASQVFATVVRSTSEEG